MFLLVPSKVCVYLHASNRKTCALLKSAGESPSSLQAVCASARLETWTLKVERSPKRPMQAHTLSTQLHAAPSMILPVCRQRFAFMCLLPVVNHAHCQNVPANRHASSRLRIRSKKMRNSKHCNRNTEQKRRQGSKRSCKPHMAPRCRPVAHSNSC